MTRASLSLLVAFAAGGAACGGLTDRRQLPPQGQILLYVDTDAWLPPSPGASEDGVPALFHKIRFEMFAPGETTACDGCTRDFAIDRTTVAQGRASVGFVPRAGVSGYRVRVRLYRASGAGEMRSTPRTESTIESVVALPPTAEEGIVEITVPLATDDVGAPRGTLDEPITPVAGRPAASRVGSWHSDLRRGCSREPEDGEVCVPGGAFWMGDPTYYIPIPERLVALAPFFMDTTEVTVAAFRASKLATGTVSAPDPVPHSRAAHCTFDERPSASDALALNCVSFKLAGDFCAAHGGALPTEAQYEYVASAFRSYAYPWGADQASCADAVFARSDKADDIEPQKRCGSLGFGVAAPGSGARDRVRVGDRDVVDLAGNLAEWMRDAYGQVPGPCWDSPAINPVCEHGLPDRIGTRGGDWNSVGGAELAAAARSYVDTSKASGMQIGFRCVRND